MKTASIFCASLLALVAGSCKHHAECCPPPGAVPVAGATNEQPRVRKLSIRVHGLPRRGPVLCGGCTRRVEAVARAAPGVRMVRFDPTTEQFELEVQPDFRMNTLAEKVRQAGEEHDKALGLEGRDPWEVEPVSMGPTLLERGAK